MAYTTVSVIKDGPVARVSFCRPEIHNAFNDTLIYELTDVFAALNADRSLRVIVLTGEGKSFCAGADLNWMRRVKDYSFEKNLEEALALANLFYLIYTTPLPVIGRINGAAIGGGTGFVSVCDIAVAAESAKFSFSEVKIGVVPACIGPYVIRKIERGRPANFSSPANGSPPPRPSASDWSTASIPMPNSIWKSTNWWQPCCPPDPMP